jgi:anti-sigma-K factor RskA
LATPVLDKVLQEGSPCAGFAADTYDRYVLGLLDSAERANVDRELEQQCPACVAGVQRSINLWLVFAGSLQQVEPAADFRARLIRIAELSNRVLTVPKRYKRKPAILASSLVVICLVLAMLLLFTFLAGKQSAQLDIQSLKTEIANLHSESDENQAKLQEESDRRNKEAQAKLNHPSQPGNPRQNQEDVLKAQIQQYQAEIESLNAGFDRDRERASNNSTLVSALENPGVKLLTFKIAEGPSSAAYAGVTAYAFVIENAKVLFVASKMPPPQDSHQYQLWLVRKSDHHFVSLGLFTAKPDVPAVVTYEDKETIADLAGLLVTDEGADGSKEPSDTKVLETPGAASAAVPAPAPEVQDSPW